MNKLAFNYRYENLDQLARKCECASMIDGGVTLSSIRCSIAVAMTSSSYSAPVKLYMCSAAHWGEIQGLISK